MKDHLVFEGRKKLKGVFTWKLVLTVTMSFSQGGNLQIMFVINEESVSP